MDVEVVEIVPGEYDVTPPTGAAVRVLVPPGVGVPGVDEAELAGTIVEELIDRGRPPSGTVDVAQLLRGEPDLLAAVAERVDEE